MVAALTLLVLLVVAFRQPPGWVEGFAAAAGILVCVESGEATWATAGTAVSTLLPVVAFLTAILVVSARCADLGLFEAIGQRLSRPGASGSRLLLLTFLAAVGVTAVLGLDATVVLLAPVVLAAARYMGVSARPALSACVRLANSSSLLLPVSNLTTLLAMHVLRLSFGRFALAMAPAWLVVILVEYAGHRLCYSEELRDTGPRVATTPVDPLPRFALVVLGLMLAGFVAGSAYGVAPAWSAATAAALLTAETVRRRTDPVIGMLGRTVASAQLGLAAFVLGLGVVVDALVRGGLGRYVAGFLPHAAGLPQLLLLAALATVLANLLNNLPATLLLVPLVAPLGTVAVLATLVGINVGSSLTWTGSLANLLWRRTLTGAGAPPSGRDFHRVALVTAPVGVVLGVIAVWAWSGVAL